MQSFGVDVGGTFTDLIFFDSSTGDVVVKKVPSTPADQPVGVKNGIEAMQEELLSFHLDVLIHGTTVATNKTFFLYVNLPNELLIAVTNRKK